MSDTINEHLIYIHGVSEESNEDHRKNQNHQEMYDRLHDGVTAVKTQFPNRSDWENGNRCDVEWGWNYDHHSSPEGDRLLAEAQEKFADGILPQIKDANDSTINPLRLLLFTMRELMIKGFSDMFYYASRDGKSSIRATVASQIIRGIHEPLEKGEPISLTLLGHSAGSVVAFDFLFYLFAPQDILNKYQDKHEHQHEFIEKKYLNIDAHTLEDFDKLRHFADNQKLRIRRLITFGSPISMLAFRSNAVLKILASGEKLNPSHYGLEQNPKMFGNPLKGPRWINFWDQDDIISWPAKALMQNSPVIEDIYTDVGDRVATVHNEYWSRKIVHEKIAAHW